jgi:hypothetical protein
MVVKRTMAMRDRDGDMILTLGWRTPCGNPHRRPEWKQVG